MGVNTKKYYLRENVYIEPLINHWYAWPYLIPPATLSRHITNTHRRIMTSFVNNAELHALASKEDQLSGGEFLDRTKDEVPKIRTLIAEIGELCSDLIRLSEAITQLEALLREHTTGLSIEPLYKLVPQALKGLVELHFDTEHRATYRFIEPLIYHSDFYKPSLQTISLGMLPPEGDRPFVLSTPRIVDDDHLQLKIDFNHPAFDRIACAREKPIDEQELMELVRTLDQSGGTPMQKFFTESAPSVNYTPVDSCARLSYLGHAGFLVDTGRLAVLVDPVITARSEFIADEVISFSELPPKIDFICLTHTHQDHTNLETLLQLRYKTNRILVPKNNGGTIMDPSLKLLLKQLKFDVVEFDDLDSLEIDDVKIVAIPFLGEHGDLNIRSKTAWLIEVAGEKLFFGADSSNPDSELYVNLKPIIGEPDILAIGMECVGAPYTWIYGALHTQAVSKQIKQSRRLNGSDFEQAGSIIDVLNPKQVYVYALGKEPWYKYFMGIEYNDKSTQIVESNKLIETCISRGIPAKSLYGKEVVDLRRPSEV